MQENKEFIPPIGQEKKKSKVTKLIVIVLILFLATWVLAIAVSDRSGLGVKKESKPPNLIQVGGYDFYILEDYTFGTYLTASEGRKVPIAFRLDPRKAENISLDYAAVRSILSAPKAYITFNPNQQGLGKFAVASAEISRITSLYNIPTVGAYTEDSKPVNPSIPIRTCADAGKNVVIALMLAEHTEVASSAENCVLVKGKDADDLILAADKLGMNLVGIQI